MTEGIGSTKTRAPQGRSRIRLLIVEDDRAVAGLLQDMARDLGWEVIGTAREPAEALAMIQSETPIDMAVLDVNLGGRLSYGVADALAARGVPFVVATGYRGPLVDGRFKDNAIIFKPFTSETLEQSMRRALAAGAVA